MSKAQNYLIQLNSESKRFISAIDAEQRQERISTTLDKLQSETQVSVCGAGLDIITKQKKTLCTIVDTVVLFPSQEMQDIFTKTLFATP